MIFSLVYTIWSFVIRFHSFLQVYNVSKMLLVTLIMHGSNHSNVALTLKMLLGWNFMPRQLYFYWENTIVMSYVLLSLVNWDLPMFRNYYPHLGKKWLCYRKEIPIWELIMLGIWEELFWKQWCYNSTYSSWRALDRIFN